MKTMILAILMLICAVSGVFAGVPAAGPDGEQPNILMQFLPFIIIIGIFYFLIIRPQNKKKKEVEKMLSAIKKGDKIVTIGGLYGTVQSVKETTVILKIDDNVKVEFLRSAISSVITPSKEKEDNEASKDELEDKTGESGNE